MSAIEFFSPFSNGGFENYFKIITRRDRFYLSHRLSSVNTSPDRKSFPLEPPKLPGPGCSATKRDIAMKSKILSSLVVVGLSVVCDSISTVRAAQVDWLLNPAPFKAMVNFDSAKHELTLENGLTSRTLRLEPNAATVDYRNLVTGEQLLRAAWPIARRSLKMKRSAASFSSGVRSLLTPVGAMN
jgi:hypothetical protein